MIARGGIGGLTLGLMLHQRAICCTPLEAASEVRELGVGINLLPNAVRELAALAAYEADRLPKMATIIALNRKGGGPERVIDFVAERAPGGFSDIGVVVTHQELAGIVSGYAQVAGFAVQDSIKTSP